MRVSGMPRFTVGQKDIVFISDTRGVQFSPLVGLMHGRYRVQTDAATARDYITRDDGAPLESEADVQLPKPPTPPPTASSRSPAPSPPPTLSRASPPKSPATRSHADACDHDSPPRPPPRPPHARRSAALGLLARAFDLDTEKWKTTPVTMQLQLGSGSGTLLDGSTSWGAVAEDALATWNNVLTNFKFNVVRDSTAAQARGNRLNNVFFASTYYGTAFDSRTLAITLISTSSTNGISNGYIETDVIFNTAVGWNSYARRPPHRLRQQLL